MSRFDRTIAMFPLVGDDRGDRGDWRREATSRATLAKTPSADQTFSAPES
jgi:hypothetical protein